MRNERSGAGQPAGLNKNGGEGVRRICNGNFLSSVSLPHISPHIFVELGERMVWHNCSLRASRSIAAVHPRQRSSRKRASGSVAVNGCQDKSPETAVRTDVLAKPVGCQPDQPMIVRRQPCGQSWPPRRRSPYHSGRSIPISRARSRAVVCISARMRARSCSLPALRMRWWNCSRSCSLSIWAS